MLYFDNYKSKSVLALLAPISPYQLISSFREFPVTSPINFSKASSVRTYIYMKDECNLDIDFIVIAVKCPLLTFDSFF